MSVTTLQRAQLSDFLKSCRARTAPQSVGLTPAGRRRTQGLRREDVAALAGLSATWYTWLEQGRDVHPSEEMLERLSVVLKLSPAEREYLFLLAQHRPAPLAAGPEAALRPAIDRMLESIQLPALVHNLRWDVVAWSRVWPCCFPDFGARPPGDCNLLKILLTQEEFTRDPEYYERLVRRVLSEARLDYSRMRGDPRFEQLIEELEATTPAFRRYWRSADVVSWSEGTYTERYPPLGEVTYEHTSYAVEGAAGLRLLIFSPVGEESRRVLDALIHRARSQCALTSGS